MVELEPTTPKLKNKASVRGLNAPAGGRPKSGVALTRSATISTPSPSPSSSLKSNSTTKSSPGRGGKLTVRIEGDMTSYAQLIKSAPVKTIRKLPVPPMPATAIEGPRGESSLFPVCAPASRSEYAAADRYSVPASLHPLPRTPQTPRMVRPLPPCPPSLPSPQPKEMTAPRPTATLASTLTPTPTLMNSPSPPSERVPKKAAKPLPIPGVKTEPIGISSLSDPSTLPNTLSLPPTSTLTPTRPRRTVANGLEKEKPSMSSLRLEETPRSHPKREADVIHLKFRHNPSLSLDSDTSTSEDDEYASDAEPAFRRQSRTAVLREDRKADSREAGPKDKGARLPEKQETGEKRSDLENFVDYSWMLSNRKLYRLDALASQQVAGGKWLWEKKGKRITERDFENILQMLRTL